MRRWETKKSKFFEVEHKHNNPVRSFESVHIHKSVVEVSTWLAKVEHISHPRKTTGTFQLSLTEGSGFLPHLIRFVCKSFSAFMIPLWFLEKINFWKIDVVNRQNVCFSTCYCTTLNGLVGVCRKWRKKNYVTHYRILWTEVQSWI